MKIKKLLSLVILSTTMTISSCKLTNFTDSEEFSGLGLTDDVLEDSKTNKENKDNKENNNTEKKEESTDKEESKDQEGSQEGSQEGQIDEPKDNEPIDVNPGEEVIDTDEPKEEPKEEPEVIKYKITFVVDGKETTKEYKAGQMPSYGTYNPVKAPVGNKTYEFKRWVPTITTVTSDATYVAEFTELSTPLKSSYNITFKYLGSNGVETTKVNTFAYDTVPCFNPAGKTTAAKNSVPTVSTAQHKYIFSNKWEPAIQKVTRDTEYTAVYTKSDRKYNIKFNVDGEVTSKTYLYGEMPSFGSTPTKADDGEIKYKFVKWDPEIKAVDESTTYTAVFTGTAPITFVVNGKSETTRYTLGQTPNPKTPTKEPTKTIAYPFVRWEPALTVVDGPKTYTAVFTEEVRKYKVTFNYRDKVFKTKYYEYEEQASCDEIYSHSNIVFTNKEAGIGYFIDNNRHFKYFTWVPQLWYVLEDNQEYNASFEFMEHTWVYKAWTDDLSKVGEKSHMYYTAFDEVDALDSKIYQRQKGEFGEQTKEQTNLKAEMQGDKIKITDKNTGTTKLLTKVPELDFYLYLSIDW